MTKSKVVFDKNLKTNLITRKKVESKSNSKTMHVKDNQKLLNQTTGKKLMGF